MAPDAQLEKLWTRAEEAQGRAFVRASGFKVGAALEMDDGSIFAGCNVENASYGGTICAERTAMVSAVAAGKQVFTRLVLVSDNPDPISPCGICRQFLAQFSKDAVVISRGKNKSTKQWTLAALIPDAFKFEDITRGTP